MCLGVDLLGLILLWVLCASWIWIFVSFPIFKMFSSVISSNKFSAPFSLSSTSGKPIMQMLLHLMILLSYLNVFSFFIIFFLFPVQLDCFPLLCPPGHWFVLLLFLVYYVFHPVFLIVNWVLHLWFFFNVFYLFVEDLTEVLHSFLKSSGYLYDHYFRFSIRHITYLCFV